MKKINEIEKCYKEYIQEKYIISTEELNRKLESEV